VVLKRKSEKSSLIVLPYSKQDKIDRIERVDTVARFASQNLRYFVIIILMGLICLSSIALAWIESNRAANNIKVVWLKMWPNGRWDMDFIDEDRGPEFFQSTVDYMLTQWVERRYSEIPSSIKSDYGFVFLFMSPKLQGSFVDTEGFNAYKKVADVMDCVGNCTEIRFKVTSLDHYDSDKTTFGRYEGILYRSNVFVKKTVENGGKSPKEEKIIVSVHWRIKSKEEIQKDKKMLKYNPIGMEILRYELLEDRS
jgi:hypothetical protein